MIRFDDINIRSILNVNQYISDKKYNLNKIKQKKIKYFSLNDNDLCIGYLIKTINEDKIIPVIGMDDINLKKNLNSELFKFIPKFEKKRQINSTILLIYYTNLPLEMIEKIAYHI